MGKITDKIIEVIKGLFGNAKEGTNVTLNLRTNNYSTNKNESNIPDNHRNRTVHNHNNVFAHPNTGSGVNQHNVTVVNERVYATGVNGKVYTTKVYKKLNHNFGFEIELINQTSMVQKINIGNCVYNYRSETVFNKNVEVVLRPHEHTKKDIYVDAKKFTRMKNGKYESQTWVDNRKLTRKSIILTDM